MAISKIGTASIGADVIVAEDIAANAITVAELADNAVTLAKMAGGTDGQVITYDASGDPVAVGPGTAGQVLTSAGAGAPPTFSAAGVDGIVSSADATAITIDSSERVGIGSTAPLANTKLEIKDADNASLLLHDSDAASTKLVVEIRSQGESFFMKGRNDTNTGAGPASTFMEVSLSNGAVNFPQTPVFNVFKGSNQGSPSSGATVSFGSTEHIDEGGNFSGSTFTAPVTGKYLLIAYFRVNGNDQNAYCYFRFDTSNRNYEQHLTSTNHWDAAASYMPYNGAIIADMDANDTAYISWHFASGNAPSSIDTWAFFSGCLIA